MNDVTLAALQELVQAQYKLIQEQDDEIARLQRSLSILVNGGALGTPESDINAGEIF